MLAITVLVLGCRGNSTPTGGTSGSSTSPGATTSPDVAAIAALADQACACKDAPCRDDVHERWNAASPTPNAAGEQAVAAGIEHDAAYHAAQMRLYKCLEPDHSAAAVTARVSAFAERACACARTDTACLDQVKVDFDRYLEVAWLLQDGYTPADKQALTEQMNRFERCRQVGP
jgi:hypothetical protein